MRWDVSDLTNEAVHVSLLSPGGKGAGITCPNGVVIRV